MSQPISIHRLFSFPAFFAVALVITAYRLYWLMQWDMELSFDEAQYWLWSKELDFGYFSKPPMVAYLIAASTSLCGDVAWCVRAPSPIFHLLTSLLLFLLAKNLFDRKVAAIAAFAYLTLPGISLSSLLISADVPLLFFWTLSMVLFERATSIQKDRWWMLSGITAGLGMLSKYTMFAFLPSTLLHLYKQKALRPFITGFVYWGAVVMGLIVFAPNILWNARYGFVTVRHTNDNINLQEPTIRLDAFGDFLSAQMAVGGPILFLGMLYILLRARPFREEGTALLASFVWPLLLIASVISLLSGTDAHWAAPIYTAATVLVIYWFLHCRWYKLLIALLVINILSFAVIHQLPRVMQMAGISPTYKTDPTARVRVWHALKTPAIEALRAYPNALLMSDERKVVSTLTYLLRSADNTPYTVFKWNGNQRIDDHFDLTRDIATLVGKDFLFITRSTPEDMAKISPYFGKIFVVKELTVSLYETHTERFTLYYLHQFKGYHAGL